MIAAPRRPRSVRPTSLRGACVLVAAAAVALGASLGSGTAAAAPRPSGANLVKGTAPAGRASVEPDRAGTHYFYVYAYQYATATGARGTFKVADPSVGQNDSHSLAELSVESSDGAQIVEVGWTVDPNQFGDNFPHLFVFHWVDTVPGCYDGCGFVSTSSTEKAGMRLTVGSSHAFTTRYVAAPAKTKGQWRIYDGKIEVGYFPGSLWSTTAFTKIGLTQWFGEVAAGSTVPCSQMGNGKFGTANGADRISALAFVGGPAVNFTLGVTKASFYSGKVVSSRALQFGGPGGCA